MNGGGRAESMRLAVRYNSFSRVPYGIQWHDNQLTLETRRPLVTVELKMLTLSVVLGIVQIVAASHAASLQHGYRWTASPRDEKMTPLRGVAGRLDRALRNFIETLPLFAAVVLTAYISDTHSVLTEWGARLYFWVCVVYVPRYAAGMPLVRSLVWNVATIGIVLFIAALFSDDH